MPLSGNQITRVAPGGPGFAYAPFVAKEEAAGTVWVSQTGASGTWAEKNAADGTWAEKNAAPGTWINQNEVA